MTDKKQGLGPQGWETNGVEVKIRSRKFFAVLFAILLIFLFGSFLFSKSAGADENTLHIKQLVLGSALMCDTKEQIEAILIAHAEGGFEGRRTEYLKYLYRYNKYQEPLCQELWMKNPVIIEELISIFDGLEFPSGVYTRWVVRVSAASGRTFFITVSKPVIKLTPLPISLEGKDA